LSFSSSFAFASAARAEDCKKGLEAARKKIEERKTRDRLLATLQEVSAACPQALGAMANVMKKAAEETRENRANLLARIAGVEIGNECLAADGLSPAKDLAARCPLPKALAQGKDALARIDSGSYLFAVSLERRLEKAHLWDKNGEAILLSFLLSAALEGEASAK